MKVKLLMLSFSLLFSCGAARNDCRAYTKNFESIPIKKFKDLYAYITIDNSNFNDILWVIDGSSIPGDSIVSEINNKTYAILKVDHLERSKLASLYINKNWAGAVILQTNKCLNN